VPALAASQCGTEAPRRGAARRGLLQQLRTTGRQFVLLLDNRVKVARHRALALHCMPALHLPAAAGVN
jgi:hypothetical protein